MHLLRTLMVVSVLTVVTAVTAGAQTRSVTTGGTATGGGQVKITIEDFGKPGQRDWISPRSSRPAVVYDVTIPVAAGWTCSQITVAMYNALVAELPPIYVVQIAPTNPCILYITRPSVGTVAWVVDILVEVQGVTIQVEDGAVPTVPTAWSFIKSHGWNRTN